MDAANLPANETTDEFPSPTVYIVDDDDDIRTSISRLVRASGLVDKAFSSANEFLACFDAQQPGCLVLDIRMPGMTGLELQQTLGENGRRLPIIFITGYGDIPLITKAIRNGAIDVIP